MVGVVGLVVIFVIIGLEKGICCFLEINMVLVLLLFLIVFVLGLIVFLL